MTVMAGEVNARGLEQFRELIHMECGRRESQVAIDSSVGGDVHGG
jgi:hypothetical protein